MKSSIIRIGNSKGVRIPKALLEESGLTHEIEIKAKKGQITIISVVPDKSPSTKNITFNSEYLMSLNSLSQDWDRPEEDKAWAHLQ